MVDLIQAAYKLYFLENANIENVAMEGVWKIGSPFYIYSHHHITRLIRNVLNKGYTFEDLNERTDYRSIADGFKDDFITRGFTHPYFNDLAPLFKLKKYNQFQSDYSLRDKYLDKIKKRISYSGIIGLYLFFSCSARRKGLIKYPVLIDEDGEVKIKVIDQKIVKGKARMLFDNRFIMIDFTGSYKQGPFMGAFLADANLIMEEGSCEGVSMRINKSNWAQGKREFIITCHDFNPEIKYNNMNDIKEEFENEKFEILYPPKKGYSCNTYKKLKGINSNIEVFLGRDGNLIEISGDAQNQKVLASRDKIYFNQAILEYLKNSKSPDFIHFLQLSLEHGLFLDLDRCKGYLTDFCKSCKIDAAIKKALINEFNTHINKHINEYNGVNHKKEERRRIKRSNEEE